MQGDRRFAGEDAKALMTLGRAMDEDITDKRRYFAVDDWTSLMTFESQMVDDGEQWRFWRDDPQVQEDLSKMEWPREQLRAQMLEDMRAERAKNPRTTEATKMTQVSEATRTARRSGRSKVLGAPATQQEASSPELAEWMKLSPKQRLATLQGWAARVLPHWQPVGIENKHNRLEELDTRWHEIKHLQSENELVFEIDCRRLHGSGVPFNYGIGYEQLACEYLSGETFALPTARFNAHPSSFDLGLGLMPGKIRVLPGRLYYSTWVDQVIGPGSSWKEPETKKVREPSFLIMEDAAKAPNLLVWCTTEGLDLMQSRLRRNPTLREILKREDIVQTRSWLFRQGKLPHSELYLILDTKLTRKCGYWRG